MNSKNPVAFVPLRLSSKTRIFPFAYILPIAIAERLIAYFQVGVGLALHGIVLFALFGHAAFLYPSGKETANVLVAMSLAPLVRIFSLYAPLSQFHYVQWFLILSMPLFCAIFAVIFFQHLKEWEIGLAFKPKQLPLHMAIALTGPLFGFVEYLILRPEPMVESLSFRAIAAPIVILIVYTGFIEEFIFRGIIQHNAVKCFGTGWGLFFGTFLFAIMHIGNLSWLDVVFVWYCQELCVKLSTIRF